MSTNRGIFEHLPHKPSNPFSVVPESAATPSSPFTPVSSPFSAIPEPAKSIKIPERRKSDSPFEVADAAEGFGFEPSPSPFTAAPIEAAPAASSPFAIVPETPSRPATSTAFSAGNSPWSSQATTPAPASAPAAQPAAFAPAPAPAPASVPSRQTEKDSPEISLHQLALRAIFGIDREMSSDEMMQRARSIPGIRHIARVGHQDVATVDAMTQLLANLGFGGSGFKLYAGSVPIEFIRESGVLLAVQTDGGFAPGVRETLMIVARELGRSA